MHRGFRSPRRSSPTILEKDSSNRQTCLANCNGKKTSNSGRRFERRAARFNAHYAHRPDEPKQCLLEEKDPTSNPYLRIEQSWHKCENVHEGETAVSARELAQKADQECTER